MWKTTTQKEKKKNNEKHIIKKLEMQKNIDYKRKQAVIENIPKNKY